MIASNLPLICFLWCFTCGVLLAVLSGGSFVLSGGSFAVLLGHCLAKLVVLLGGTSKHLAVLLNFATAVLGGLVALCNHHLVLFDHTLAVRHGFLGFLELNAFGGFTSGHFGFRATRHYYKLKRENNIFIKVMPLFHENARLNGKPHTTPLNSPHDFYENVQ